MTRESESTESPFEGRTREGFFRTRIRAGRNSRTGKSQQLRVTIATKDETVALARLVRLRELAARLVPQGLTAEAAVAIKRAAAQDNEIKFELCFETALSMAPEIRGRARAYETFRELAEAWTRGELHRRWPDHVQEKRTAKRDKGRLEYLLELVVEPESKRRLGDIPLTSFTVEHAQAAMAQLPADCKRPAARRQYAQLIGRVMKLAAFPAAVITASPLPRNFLPHVPEDDILFQHFFPDEDLRLMRCEVLDYAERCFIGLCNREGGRLGEFLRKLKWSMIDVRRGTFTLPGGIHRKNSKPGRWHAEPGSIEALEPLRALGGDGPFSHLPDDGQWAKRTQTMMRTAGLDREALYYSNIDEGLQRMRGHDTRATYVTLALALGLSESHIMARTGHRTSKMVHRYDHAGEALAKSGTGCRLMPLDVALGAPVTPGRRTGWVTLDPMSAEAAELERLALPVPLLGPGGGDGPSGSRELTRPEPIDGELVDDDDGPAALGASAPRLVEVEHSRGSTGEGRPLRREALLEEPGERHRSRCVASVDRGVSGGSEAIDQDFGGGFWGFTHGGLHGLSGGETRGETLSGFSFSFGMAPDNESSMFCAVVAPAGLEPARLAARDFKSLPSAHDGASAELTTRNPVARADATAHGVSLDGPKVRRSETPEDGVLATLQAAAHAAIDAGELELVADLMRHIARHRARNSAQPAATALPEPSANLDEVEASTRSAR